MPFCENCGKEIKLTTKFCGNCGTPVNVATQASSSPQPSTQTSNVKNISNPMEKVLSVLVLRKTKSLGRHDTFSGVLTNQQLIFAQMTGDMMKEAIKQSREQAKAEGKGFFGQWSAQIKAAAAYSNRYYDMDALTILSETPGNFAIDNNTVSELKLKLKDSGNQANLREFEIEIKSSSGKYKFRMDENNDYITQLKQVYGDRVKTPFGYFSTGGMKFKIG